MSGLEAEPLGGLEQMVIGAVRRVMRPFIRLLVHQGMTLPQLMEILKGLYVEEVQQELTQRGERCTHSRISVMSGVHRKDVRRLLETQAGTTPVREKITLTARLLSLWCGDPQFIDHQGEPLILPKVAVDPSAVGFNTLVQTVSQDIRPRTILDEWLQRGIVSIDPQQLIRLNQDVMFPSGDIEAKLHYFARNTADHIAACDHNLCFPDQTFPERALFYDGLSPASVTEIESLVRHWSQEALLAVNRRAVQLASQDDAGGGGDERFTFGLYFYKEEAARHGS